MIKIAICDDDLDSIDNFAKILTDSFANAGQEINICKCFSGKNLIDTIEKDK